MTRHVARDCALRDVAHFHLVVGHLDAKSLGSCGEAGAARLAASRCLGMNAGVCPAMPDHKWHLEAPETDTAFWGID